MDAGRSRFKTHKRSFFPVRQAYSLLAPRAYTVLIFAALFCTLAVKLFHALRCDLLAQYPTWILADVSALLTTDLILSLLIWFVVGRWEFVAEPRTPYPGLIHRWPRKWVIRAATALSAIVCTWAAFNAGWLIRTGTQILPTEILPLLRDPVNTLAIVLVNMLRMAKASAILVIPGSLAFVFAVCTIASPLPPGYRPNHLAAKVVLSLVISALTATAHLAAVARPSTQATSAGLRFNCHIRAVMTFVKPEFRHLARRDFINPSRQLPTCDHVMPTFKPHRLTQNVVIVVLEGIQYSCTSLAAHEDTPPDAGNDPTPFLGCLARQGVNFTNARSSITHTTKALFALLTGRLPSASHDIAETVPVARPYASIATILRSRMGFRTAFFQSAKGTFECRPGLVHNLGFDKFSAREDLGEPNSFVGYLGCDEFAMLKPITDWIQADKKPFLIVVLCSVTHDPYEVPPWVGHIADEPLDKYRQAVAYTDSFLAALDIELARLNLADKTIFCVIGDHGEGFGEHGMRGHERIIFEEVLRIPFCLRAPLIVPASTTVTDPVSSADLTPTLLALLGFDTTCVGFDGADALSPLPPGRKVYFAGWMEQGPAGYVQGNSKFVHDPADNTAWLYDMAADPAESARIALGRQQSDQLAQDVVAWRKSTIFRLSQSRTGRELLFGTWLCKWTGRTSTAKRRDVPSIGGAAGLGR